MPPFRSLTTLTGIVLIAGCTFGPAYSASGAQPSRAGERAVAIAEKLVGKPYRYGGTGPRTFDCSGLIYYSYRQAGAAVPRTTKALYRAAVPINPHKLQPGDLIFFQIAGKISHVGIYAGNGRFVHAPSSGKEVSFASLKNPYWKDHIIAAGRLPGR